MLWPLRALVEEPLHRLLERPDLQTILAAHDEGALAYESGQRATEVRDALVFGRLEELARQEFLTRCAVLGPMDDYASSVSVGGATNLHAIGACAIGQSIQTLLQM